VLHSIKEYNLTHRQYFIASIIISAVLLLALGVLAVRKIYTDPNIVFLASKNKACWIRFPAPPRLYALKYQKVTATYRTRFSVKNVPDKALLNFRAMKRASVWLDNQLIYKVASPLDEWKKLRQVDLAPFLKPGIHELHISVINKNGHPMLLAYCNALRLFTGEAWECSIDGKHWEKALSADHMLPVPISRKFQRVDKAFLSHMDIFLLLFFIVFALTLLANRQNKAYISSRLRPTASTIRWVLLGAWSLLAANNIFRLPLYTGMDFNAHMEYIMYIANKMRIPLATEGWQMFEPPLFYIIEAIIYKAVHNIFSIESTYRILRIIPLMCGAAQIELSYRALKYVFPKREDLQAIGTIIGGLLPMNIYMSQVVGTEPLEGFLTAIVVVLSMKIITSPSKQSTQFFIITGLFLGLALLAKVSSVLIILPAALFISWALFKDNQPTQGTQETIKLIIKLVGIMIGIAFLVSSWYYLRNYLELGHFFIGGWDPRKGFTWWQNPGYRTFKQFISFGEALLYPVYSISSIWNSLYSTMWLDGFLSGMLEGNFIPPWNFGFMLSDAWLSLLPSVAIILGILIAFKKSNKDSRPALLFSATCIFIYISATIYLYLCIPVYSIGKSKYTLGLIPCFAVLGAAGFQVITRKTLLRAATYGLLACWAIYSYAGFLVMYNPDCAAEERLYLANIATNMGKTDEAINLYKKALIVRPGSARIHYNLAVLLASSGKNDEAVKHYTEALRIEPNNPEIHNNLGAALLLKGNVDAAIRHFREALRIQPGNADIENNLKAALKARAKIEKINQAIYRLKNKLKYDPKNQVLHAKLGNLYRIKGSMGMAIEEYKKALAIDPHSVVTLNKLAMVYANNDEYDKALLCLRKIILLKPDSPGAYYNIACIYARLSKIDNAIKWLKDAIDRGFDNWELIKKDPDLKNIRGTEYYKMLISRHN